MDWSGVAFLPVSLPAGNACMDNEEIRYYPSNAMQFKNTIQLATQRPCIGLTGAGCPCMCNRPGALCLLLLHMLHNSPPCRPLTTW